MAGCFLGVMFFGSCSFWVQSMKFCQIANHVYSVYCKYHSSLPLEVGLGSYPQSFREAEKNENDCEYFGRNKLKQMLWPGTLL